MSASSSFAQREESLVGTSLLAKRQSGCTWMTILVSSFRKKDIYANGQLIQANRWVASMLPYLERVLQQL